VRGGRGRGCRRASGREPRCGRVHRGERARVERARGRLAATEEGHDRLEIVALGELAQVGDRRAHVGAEGAHQVAEGVVARGGERGVRVGHEATDGGRERGARVAEPVRRRRRGRRRTVDDEVGVCVVGERPDRHHTIVETDAVAAASERPTVSSSDRVTARRRAVASCGSGRGARSAVRTASTIATTASSVSVAACAGGVRPPPRLSRARSRAAPGLGELGLPGDGAEPRSARAARAASSAGAAASRSAAAAQRSMRARQSAASSAK
jgi:hypothetical protein